MRKELRVSLPTSWQPRSDSIQPGHKATPLIWIGITKKVVLKIVLLVIY